jgi:hypothetical protein
MSCSKIVACILSTSISVFWFEVGEQKTHKNRNMIILFRIQIAPLPVIFSNAKDAYVNKNVDDIYKPPREKV